MAVSESSASFRLRELQATANAIKSEISMCQVYIDNPSRWRQEMEREEKKLQLQQERVDRLRKYSTHGEEMVSGWKSRYAQLQQEIHLVSNEALIDRVLRLQNDLNDIQKSVGPMAPLDPSVLGGPKPPPLEPITSPLVDFDEELEDAE